MRTTPFTLILFFVALNVSLFIINETNVITSNDVAPPYTDPEEIPNLLISFDLTTETLLTGITIAGVGTLIGLIFGNLVNGGLLALVLFALNMLFPVVRWVVVGFPLFLLELGVHQAIVTGITALMAVVWFWFLLGMLGQRQMEK
jgi:hypothetical protein